VEKVLVVRRTGIDVAWNERDLWWHETVYPQSNEHAAQAFPAEHPLFILYTSGTTGKPKGIVHTSGGYLTQASYTHRVVFDLKPETDVYWCTADIGWVTGHSYIVYGPLANGATQVIYEGTPNTPHEGRHWEIIDKYGVTIYYTAPTLIRTFMKWGAEIPARYALTSLRPLPGISAKVVNDEGHEVAFGEGGYLVIDRPWPAMLRTIFGDDDRYRDTYWSRFADQGYYFAGDGAKYDADGAIWLLGRVDDVMNVSGHRISTTEVESALVSHPAVAEAAVVGAADDITGQGIAAFVILRSSWVDTGADLIAALRQHVATEIGPIAKPKSILIVPELPKTRSGKIMRRLLRDIAEGRAVGDVTTLQDGAVMGQISTGLAGATPRS
jgi:acetyl-CoA synthetase